VRLTPRAKPFLDMLFNPLPEGAYRITQGFGENAAYYKRYGHDGHNGYDFAPVTPGVKGVVVYAPHDGYARVVNEGGVGYGLYAEVLSLPYNAQGRRRKSVLAHLERAFVTSGQFVSQGDAVGAMGTTGDSTGIHLHWTYKVCDRSGKTLDKDNGFAGAVRIGKYTRKWLQETIE
jgi:murein DD-endopeptidase MepM/ murein hydrolase activator NlpD